MPSAGSSFGGSPSSSSSPLPFLASSVSASASANLTDLPGDGFFFGFARGLGPAFLLFAAFPLVYGYNTDRHTHRTHPPT